MQCPECKRFPSFDDSNDPEVSDLEINEDGHISCQARIVLTCAEDGTELKEATFDLETDLDDEVVKAHQGEGHELRVEDGSVELTSRLETTRKKVDKRTGEVKEVPVPVRGQRTFYGVSIEVLVKCSCLSPDEFVCPILTLSDEIQSSAMDEMI